MILGQKYKLMLNATIVLYCMCCEQTIQEEEKVNLSAYLEQRKGNQKGMKMEVKALHGEMLDWRKNKTG